MPTSHNLSQPLTTSHNLLIRSRPPIATQARALVLFFGIFLRQVPTYLPTQMSVNNCIILMCVHLNIIVPNLIILVHLSIQLCTTQLIASLFHSHIIVSLSLTHFSILSFVKASCGGTYTHIHTHRFLKHIPFPTFKFYSMLSISKKNSPKNLNFNYFLGLLFKVRIDHSFWSNPVLLNWIPAVQ